VRRGSLIPDVFKRLLHTAWHLEDSNIDILILFKIFHERCQIRLENMYNCGSHPIDQEQRNQRFLNPCPGCNLH